MPRYSNISIFRTIDLDDISSLRRLVKCLYHELEADSLPQAKSQVYGLTRLENAWVNRILAAVYRALQADFNLLYIALYRYVHDDFSDDEILIRATKELEELAEEGVLLVPEGHWVEYGNAHERFAKLVKAERRAERILPMLDRLVLSRLRFDVMLDR